MHFITVLFIIVGHFPLFLMQNTSENHQDASDTPSPEWIKYQQERYGHHFQKESISNDSLSITNEDKSHINVKESKKQATATKVHSKIETTSRQNSVQNHKEKEIEEDVYMDPEANASDISGNSLKYPSIQGFIEFLKSLRKTWIEKSLFRFDNKLAFLYNLKDTLMRAIEQQFTTLWPDDDDEDEGRHLRHKRGILDESSIDFPPEAALMSINFLTFAVFLIKLVLQVVNIIKSKHVQLSSLGFSTDGLTG